MVRARRASSALTSTARVSNSSSSPALLAALEVPVVSQILLPSSGSIHDGWTNFDEISRARDFGAGIRYWVHPYNPCLPDYESRAC